VSKGKYLIFIAVLFLTSCIVSFNDYELQPKNYVINKEFDEVVFDMDFINTKQEMNLEKVNNLIFQVYFDFFFMNDCFV